MNRKPEVIVRKCVGCSTIPLSHLSLDLAVPTAGWPSFFSSRGVEVVDDDLGRPAVPRSAVADLIAERAADQERRVREQARRARERKPRPTVPGIRVPAGTTASALAVMVAADRDREDRGWHPYGSGEFFVGRKP